MEFKFRVQTRIQKPVAEVFDAVYNPRKLEKYFTTKRASAALDAGTTVTWEWDYWPTAYEVHVKEMVRNELIAFEWLAHNGHTITRVEIRFEPLGEAETKVEISESGWDQNESGLKNSYENCAGWMQVCCSLKAFVEYDINLTRGFF
ncbi:MAG: ATPase [Acidobacteria bacterium]|nr:ATPase [Acidobacteriota bacterium]